MKLFREMFGELSAWGRFWLYLGLATLVCAAAMSFAFGAEISLKHALFLMCLTAIAAFLPEAAYSQWVEGRKIVAVSLALIAVPTLAIEFYTHAGYTAGLRGSNIETAMVQNTKWTGAQEAVIEDAANQKLWRAQKAALIAEREGIIAANPWVTTINADSLRSEIANLDGKIASETKGGRQGRKAGCGVVCEQLKDEKVAAEKRMASIVALNSVGEKISELDKRIEATQRILDGKRTAAATTEHKSSAVEHQNKFLAKSIAMVSAGTLTPTEFMSEGSQQTVNLAMALAGTGLPALALFIAGLYRRRDDFSPDNAARVEPFGNALAPVTSQSDGYSKPALSLAPTHRETLIVHNNDKLNEILARWAGSNEARAIAA